MTGPAARPPLFSVVVPTFNRLPLLRRVLVAWERQDPGIPFELIVVDDGSSDGTGDLVGRWISRRFDLTVLTQVNAGPARARNRALGQVRGRYVFFSGDDIVPSPDLLSHHLRFHEGKGRETTVVIGRTVWPDDIPVTATMRHIDGPGAEQFSFHYLKDGEEYDFRHFYTSNLSVRSSFLSAEPGGFCEDFPKAAFEDIEFSYRLSRVGQRIFYCQDAVASHYHPYDARTFFRRQLGCGAMAHLFESKWPLLSKWFLGPDLRRVQVEAATAARRGRGPEAAPCAALEEILIREACRRDDEPGIVHSPLLVALFRYAFVKGYVEAAREGPEQASILGSFAREILRRPIGDYLAGDGFRGSPVDPSTLRTVLESLGLPVEAARLVAERK